MSVRIMTAVWDLDLTPVEKLVLLALADCANDEGLAWPSIATIRRKANVGERTVQRSIRAMEQKGLIQRIEVVGKGCKYTLNPRQSDTPATKSPPPESAQTPATVAPKPSRTITNKKTAHAIPSNWEPQEFGRSTKSRRIVEQWSQDEFETHIEGFIAHHIKTGNKFECWQAAWSTWVLNTEKFKPKGVRSYGNHGNSNSNAADLARQKLGLG